MEGLLCVLFGQLVLLLFLLMLQNKSFVLPSLQGVNGGNMLEGEVMNLIGQRELIGIDINMRTWD